MLLGSVIISGNALNLKNVANGAYYLIRGDLCVGNGYQF